MILTATNKSSVIDKDGEVLVELVRQLLQRYPDEFLQIPFIRTALATMKIDALDKDTLKLGRVDDPAALRDLDARGPKRIAVAPIPDQGLGEAINDRLQRAAAPKDDPTP